MKKILLMLLLLFVISISVYAQEETEDVVYLKNGIVVKGIITELIINKSLKIKVDDSTFVYQMDVVEKITNEPVLDINEPSHDNTLCYQGNLEIGYGFALTSYGYDNFKINMINGISINPYYH